MLAVKANMFETVRRSTVEFRSSDTSGITVWACSDLYFILPLRRCLLNSMTQTGATEWAFCPL